MKYLISMDLEGAACVVGEPGKTLSQSRDFSFACGQVVREANALIRGLFNGEAKSVILWDNHNGSLNIRYEDVDPRASILCGVGGMHRLEFLRELEIDGLILLGYHGCAGSEKAVLAHTYSSTRYQEVRLNGMLAGEVTLDSLLAAERGVPLMLVAGDDSLRNEILDVQRDCIHVVTKHALGRNFCLSRSAAGICEELETAGRAAAVAGLPPVPQVPKNIRLSFRYQRPEHAEEHLRSDARYTRIDACTVEATAGMLSQLL